MAARTDAEAFDLARELAKYAVETLQDVMENPERNSGPRVSAACKILEIAGVGALEADKRHEELLTALKGKIDREAYAQVLRALAGHAGSSRGGTGEPRVGSAGAH